MNDLDIALVGQTSLPGLCPIAEAVQQLATDSGRDERGAIFTRKEVVDFMLDLVGYSADQDLTSARLLEPSFGGGEFVVAAVARLVESWKRRGCVADLAACIYAVELHQSTFEATRESVRAKLKELGFEAAEAARLTQAWLHFGDFLLAPIPGRFDFVVGNPPYVRQELIPAALLEEYRRRFSTLYDRADLYVPFIERSLNLLAESGQMTFICADRWTKNKYGGPLRAKSPAGSHCEPLSI
ncbi:Eco57I restriction-modification methylase domain-containing protein [Curvibacter lanceolatus]|uniref:Eco57I restriction-modification methylase domain-containing protein n=1 Tax=Curvibacter lanceolatus TaxID=86182 RepID=UPI001FE1E089|nr:Eco57I restriction-modification methylase domain-containing protein [Curvibacter lanceolatus]